MMDELLRAAPTYGFCAIVCGFLLWERRTTMAALTEAVRDLKQSLGEMLAFMKGQRTK